ncbi:alpha-keto acid decarboxylase family protein [Aureivirga sp. CE67]|uniref:alpha-keto acid decarboxylase family protein n=1 Tax=Aureivirga sp. CE67 TaxID=1788983 RepID=UPI0018CA0374|nr:thiamine pyrophosphate-binding protein [Aureivirga sp. CE67]
MKTTVGDYLLMRLKELGIDDVFGVPGDYNLGFLDQVVHYKGLRWIGNCNELNGAYAADGYARIKGAAALVTTYGVGELSAINGIAGSFAEYLPVVKIVGMPSAEIQKSDIVFHHSIRTNEYNVFEEMYAKVTKAQTILTVENAAEEIDRVLTVCFKKKLPVYIGVSSDICYQEIEVEKKPLELTNSVSAKETMEEAAIRITKVLSHSKRPLLCVDLCAMRHDIKKDIEHLIKEVQIPFITTNMGKAYINESNPLFVGVYSGENGNEKVYDFVHKADCIISFGALISDLNTSMLPKSSSIEIHSNHVRVKNSHYYELYFHDFIPFLSKKIKDSKLKFSATKIPKKEKNHFMIEKNFNKIEQAYFWDRMGYFFKEHSTIIAGTGTSLFGLLPIRMPDNVNFISQIIWASIGYSVGALLGTSIADSSKENILFVGDGAFQLTAQEVSTMLRYETTPIIFLLNNDGYTIERVIHGEKMEYNDIQMWNYADLPKMFGENVWTTKVTTTEELETCLSELRANDDKLRFVEVIMERMDVPEMLMKMFRKE